jgi:hypothetical protein
MTRMGENETQRVFLISSRNSIFFSVLTWTTPRQQRMDAGWMIDGRLELLVHY